MTSIIGSQVLTVNGQTGPDVVLDAFDVGALDKAARNFTETSRSTPLLVNAPGFVRYLTLNLNVPVPALYQIRVGGSSTGSSGNTEIRARIILGGAVGPIDLGGPYLSYDIANGVFILAGNVEFFFFATGVSTIGLDLEVPGGPGTVTATNANIMAWREEV